MRVVVVIFLLLILLSLASALYFLVRDRGGTRTVKALTWRIGLSIGLFLLLMGGLHFGLIPGRGP